MLAKHESTPGTNPECSWYIIKLKRSDENDFQATPSY